jgi:hypothetical protein
VCREEDPWLRVGGEGERDECESNFNLSKAAELGIGEDDDTPGLRSGS